jgi:hypothetical protein
VKLHAAKGLLRLETQMWLWLETAAGLVAGLKAGRARVSTMMTVMGGERSPNFFFIFKTNYGGAGPQIFEDKNKKNHELR